MKVGIQLQNTRRMVSGEQKIIINAHQSYLERAPLIPVWLCIVQGAMEDLRISKHSELLLSTALRTGSVQGENASQNYLDLIGPCTCSAAEQIPWNLYKNNIAYIMSWSCRRREGVRTSDR